MSGNDLQALQRNLSAAGFDDGMLALLSNISTPSTAEVGTAEKVDRQLLLHAALSGTFLPRQLKSSRGNPSIAEVDVLLASSDPVTTRRGRAWRIRLEERRRTLAAAGRRELQDVLAQLPQRTDDLHGALLQSLVRGDILEPEELSLDELEALAQVVGWLQGTGLETHAPDEEALRRAQRRRELLDPFLTLVGRSSRNISNGDRDRFVGREREIERIRHYVGVLPPESWPDALRRGTSNLWSAIGAGADRNEPLKIHGAGGAGKSTLIAKFILEHARFMLADPERREMRLPFVYIDFDRATITAREPLQLLLDIASQIPVWLPETEGNLAAFRENLRRLIDGQSEGEKMRSRETRSELLGLCQRFRDIVEAVNQGSAPVIIFFDTYEMVQYNAEAVSGLKALIQSLREPAGGPWRNVRIIVSGRGSLLDIETHQRPIYVGPLTLRATRELMSLRNETEELGLSEPQVNALATALRGSPLDVIIVTRWLKDNPRQAKAFVQEIAEDDEIKAAGESPETGGLEARVTALLVRRMIDHIASRAVRRIAIPGFVVRTISPDVIREVMMPAQGDVPEKEVADSRAAILFRRLQNERWLVYRQGPVLRHRAEVRRAMVRLLRERDRGSFYETNDRAIHFFLRHKENRIERAEAIYHLLLAEQPRIAEAEALWRPDLASYLASGVEDLDGPAQDYLRIKLGHSYSVDALAIMPDAVLRSVIAASSRSILDRLGADSAVRLAKLRPELERDSRGRAFMNEARYRSGQWQDLIANIREGEVGLGNLSDIYAVSGGRRETVERRQLLLALHLSSRDESLDQLWKTAIPGLTGRGGAADDPLYWEALAFSAIWQKRNRGRPDAPSNFPDALEVAARNCRHSATFPSDVRGSAALKVLALLEPQGATAILRNVDFKSHFATVSVRELSIFRELLDIARWTSARGTQDEELHSLINAGHALVERIGVPEERLILDPLLTADMGTIAERLLLHRPEALAQPMRQLLAVSHPDWVEPLGLALERAYAGHVPTRLGWFSTIEALLGHEMARGRGWRRRRLSGPRITSLADEAGHLVELVEAYRSHVQSGSQPGDPRDFLYLTKRFEQWLAALTPEPSSSPQLREVSDPEGIRDQTAQPPAGAPADDPQKLKWGGRSERNGWKVDAEVRASETDQDWFEVDLKVVPLTGKKLTGPVTFHLHDSFADPVREVEPRSAGEARLRLWAYGAFTVGVLVNQDSTPLELDLSMLAGAPKRFTER